MAKKYALYRLKDHSNKTIYIGISGSPLRRLADHFDNMDWSHELSSIDIEYFDTRLHAEFAELIAVKYNRPKYNGTYNNDTPLVESIKNKVFSFGETVNKTYVNYTMGRSKNFDAQSTVRDIITCNIFAKKYMNMEYVVDPEEIAEKRTISPRNVRASGLPWRLIGLVPCDHSLSSQTSSHSQ